MHYYRFRPYSELSLKELLYSEMYFASPEECNDPFDSKTFYRFPNDFQKWMRLLQLVTEQTKIQLDQKYLILLAEHICKKCPLSSEKIVQESLFKDFIHPELNNFAILEAIYRSACRIVQLYQASVPQFVSFSKVNNEFLMWSHYADSHKGYCLIFKAIDGRLFQSHIHRKRSIHRKTPLGFASDMSYELPKSFPFVDIAYKSEVEHLNAFLYMPVYVTGDANSEEERLSIIDQQQSHCSQKGLGWQYEKESRLILHPPPSWLFGENVYYSRQERLFHYEPSQLVGIIYGAQMSQDNRNRIHELLQERKDWIDLNNHYKRTVFRFIEFEARLSSNQRDVDIHPLSIDLSTKFYPADKDFGRLYKEWKEGIGFEREGNKSTRIKV